MLVLEYLLHSESNFLQHVVSVSLNGPIPCSYEYTVAQWDPFSGTIGAMPNRVRERYRELCEAERYDDPEFTEIEQSLFANIMYRSGVFTDCGLEALSGLNQEIYISMQGFSE